MHECSARCQKHRKLYDRAPAWVNAIPWFSGASELFRARTCGRLCLAEEYNMSCCKWTPQRCSSLTRHVVTCSSLAADLPDTQMPRALCYQGSSLPTATREFGRDCFSECGLLVKLVPSPALVEPDLSEDRSTGGPGLPADRPARSSSEPPSTAREAAIARKGPPHDAHYTAAAQTKPPL